MQNPAKGFDREFASFHVDMIEVGDFEFAARRGLQRLSVFADMSVVEVQAGHREV